MNLSVKKTAFNNLKIKSMATTTKKTAKKKPLVLWSVDMTLETFELRVMARTGAEAKKKAFAKLMRKGYGKLVNKSQTYADKF